MKIIDHIEMNINEEKIKGRELIPVVLEHEEVQKKYQKFVLPDGVELTVSLKPEIVLKNGDILYQDKKRIIYIDLIMEKVLRIRPRNSFEWARAAYNIGNMHQKAYLKEDNIYVPHDSNIEKLIESIGIPFEITHEKLEGIPVDI